MTPTEQATEDTLVIVTAITVGFLFAAIVYTAALWYLTGTPGPVPLWWLTTLDHAHGGTL